MVSDTWGAYCHAIVGHRGMDDSAKRFNAHMTKTLESSAAIWGRRAKTIPTMLGATAVALVGAPVFIPTLAAADLLRRRTTLPSVRLYLFGLQYAFNDSVEILLAPLLWLAAGFGRTLGSERSIRRHARLQMWSLALLFKRADQLLGLRLKIDTDSAPLDEPGPTIVLTRHCSIFDSSLPSMLYEPTGFQIRGVIMAELLADPGFDLLFGRLGSIFIPRDNGPDAKRQIADLASQLGPTTIAALFPEGRLFTPERLARAKGRLIERDPERGSRLASLANTLPPQAGGLSALLAGAPSADVVIIRHAGLESFQPTTSFLVPHDKPILVSAVRFDRASIPDDEATVQRWLDDRWCEMDDWVTAANLR